MNERYKTATVQVQDYRGAVHDLLAIKPYSSNLADVYLMKVLHGSGSMIMPFVVHTLNMETGGYSNGQYCQNFEEGLKVFSGVVEAKATLSRERVVAILDETNNPFQRKLAKILLAVVDEMPEDANGLVDEYLEMCNCEPGRMDRI